MRPEHENPPEIVRLIPYTPIDTQYYNEDEALKYTKNSRILEIQGVMSERALELLNLPQDKPCFLLDIGCGSGLSGEVLDENGHYWVGCDISPSMLGAFRHCRSVDARVQMWLWIVAVKAIYFCKMPVKAWDSVLDPLTVASGVFPSLFFYCFFSFLVHR
jgi:SAM-dependent methyltransferase